MLEQYNKKRNFEKTSEPKGKRGKSAKKDCVLRFVIQEHHARSLHFDFRLEYKGVLVSFAVPKNLSRKKGEKRLAVMVEDHPVDYINFEGTIPKGQYGAGTVSIWDKGFYMCQNLGKGLKDGEFKVALAGEKLKGVWAFVRMDEKNWNAIKETKK